MRRCLRLVSVWYATGLARGRSAGCVHRTCGRKKWKHWLGILDRWDRLDRWDFFLPALLTGGWFIHLWFFSRVELFRLTFCGFCVPKRRNHISPVIYIHWILTCLRLFVSSCLYTSCHVHLRVTCVVKLCRAFIVGSGWSNVFTNYSGRKLLSPFVLVFSSQSINNLVLLSLGHLCAAIRWLSCGLFAWFLRLLLLLFEAEVMTIIFYIHLAFLWAYAAKESMTEYQ